MGFAMLTIVAICVGTLSDMPSVDELARIVLRTPHVPLTYVYLLAVALLFLFIMRSTALLAATGRLLMAFGRSSETKGLNFLDECDGAPAPRTALVSAAILTAGISALSLLRDYRNVYEHIRRLGVLCTLTSYLICIGSLCFYRCRTIKARSFKIFLLMLDWFAFGFCLWFFSLTNLPAELPITRGNAPWSLLVWLAIIALLLYQYWKTAREDFLVADPLVRLQENSPHGPAEAIELGQLNTSSPGADLSTAVTKAPSIALTSLRGSEDVNTDQPHSVRSTTPEQTLQEPFPEQNHQDPETEALPSSDAQSEPNDRIPSPQCEEGKEPEKLDSSVAQCGSINHIQTSQREEDKEPEKSGSLDAQCDSTNRKQPCRSKKGKEPAQKCLDPSTCPRTLETPDVGSYKSSGPLCANCTIRLADHPDNVDWVEGADHESDSE